MSDAMSAASSPRPMVSIEAVGAEVSREAFLEESISRNVHCVVASEERVQLTSYSKFEAPPLPIRAHLFSKLHFDAPAIRLFSAREVSFYGGPSLFTLPDGAIVEESVRHWYRTGTDVASILKRAAARSDRSLAPALLSGSPPANARRLEGVHVLGHTIYSDNYYHWHVDILPILLFRNMFPGAKVLVWKTTDFVVKSLSYFGIGAKEIVVLPFEEAITVEQLVMSSTTQNHGIRMHPLTSGVFGKIKRRVCSDAPARPHRRIFVSRGDQGRRRLLNRAAVEARFASAGFEIVDPGRLAYEEQIRLFDSASVVVGEHGGGMGNIGFCRRGALAVELFNPASHDLCYLGLAEVSGLYHRILVGQSIDPADMGAAVNGDDPWTIDPDETLRQVESAMERVPPWLNPRPVWRNPA